MSIEKEESRIEFERDKLHDLLDSYYLNGKLSGRWQGVAVGLLTGLILSFVLSVVFK